MYRFKAHNWFNLGVLFLLIVSLLGPAPAVDAAAPPTETASPPAPVSPGDITLIPQISITPQIDGLCTEYQAAGAKAVTFSDAGGSTGTVYLMHNGSMLYVCVEGAPGSLKGRFGSLYLDPQGDGSSYVYAQKDDYALRVGIPGTALSSYQGSGVANGYLSYPAIDGFWSGAATDKDAAGKPADSFEYAVSAGRFQIQVCQIFGLAAYHHWVTDTGDDYGWPSNQWFDQPRTWQAVKLDSPKCGDLGGTIAYVYRGNTADATSFFNLLTGAGYTVTLVPLGAVLTTDFSTFNLVMVANDTGKLDQWGTPALTAAQVAKIKAGGRPTIGLGEGGYAFFGQLSLFIGWPHGWHGLQIDLFQAVGAPPAIFAGIATDPVQHYSLATNSVGIYLGPWTLPSDVVPIGLEDPTEDHASLIQQGCRLLWGNSGNPLAMTNDGKTVFLNSVAYMRAFQCPSEPPPPPPTCVQISKSAVPADGAAVKPGDVISYTITYTYSDDPACSNTEPARLVDSLPVGTVFVPGSASDGISPGADGALVWPVNPAAGEQSKTFKVLVSENQCADQRQVNNRAGLEVPGSPPFISNVVSHPVTCQPVTFPNENPSFIEDEINIHPYPLVAGQPNIIQVTIRNLTAITQPVTVSFQTSPDKFGIGLNFSAFDSKSLLLPPLSATIVQGTFVPAASGHFCIQIVVTGPNVNPPLVTQRNLDVTEDLHPGQPDTLTFKVRNNSSSTASVMLVVDNTCPGWAAVITTPPGGVFLNMAPGEIRDAVLTVTPPNPVVLGSGCHIDVQGWIGDQLIGGIRKLDVPPVHLPPDVIPTWEEPEISTQPDPPIAGQPAKICVELQNPLAVTRTVTLDFAVADFGAGIGFAPVGSTSVDLPPLSNNKYCIDWTPDTGGTLHRCIQVTLKQPGYQDMHSQRNVNLVRLSLASLGTLDVPFLIGNPDQVDHTLTFSFTQVGINRYWTPKIFTDKGDPAPDEILLPAGQTLAFRLKFAALAGLAPQAALPDYHFGDVSKLQVAAMLDGVQLNGFTVVLDSFRLHLPIIKR